MVHWQSFRRFFRLMMSSAVDADHRRERLRFMELNVGVPTKIAVLAILGYLLFLSDWFRELSVIGDVALPTVKTFFIAYLVINTVAIAFCLFITRWPLALAQTVTLMVAAVDTLFVSAMVVVTGGIESIIYWIFIGLIVRNAISNPIPVVQISMNLLAIASYLVAVYVHRSVVALDPGAPEFLDPTQLMASDILSRQADELLFVRGSFLLLMSVCCYGVQVLFDRDRLAELESREFVLRQEQLRSAGRLAAEIAHQLKNPLAIINNAAWSLQRQAEKSGNSTITQPLQIIRDEVDRSDHILTELMGYARLSEGRVEKLDMSTELDEAIKQAFPPEADFNVKVQVEVARGLPALLMQRVHLREVLVNLLVNARDAALANHKNEKGGHVWIEAKLDAADRSVMFTVRDDGAGIPADQVERVFEPYFTTKAKGTGLGLAIVKHNAELYGGSVRAESELGKGARFIVGFSSRALLTQ